MKSKSGFPDSENCLRETKIGILPMHGPQLPLLRLAHRQVLEEGGLAGARLAQDEELIPATQQLVSRQAFAQPKRHAAILVP